MVSDYNYSQPHHISYFLSLQAYIRVHTFNDRNVDLFKKAYFVPYLNKLYNVTWLQIPHYTALEYS